MMKVALINKNPAVSRLITLSLNKIGTEYSEFEDLNGFDDAQFDFIIIDSDVDSSELATTKDVMYLASRGESKPEFATLMLEKPFLPTEFISVFEQNRPKDEPAPEHGASEQGESDFGDFSDEAMSFDEMSGFKLPDIDTNLENFADLDKELSEGVSDDLEMDSDISMPEIESDEGLLDSLEELDELKELVSEDLADESETASESAEEEMDLGAAIGKESDLAELSSLVDEIENMPETSEIDEALGENLDDIISQNDVVGLVDDEKIDGELDEIDQSKFELSEIESLDEALNSEEAEKNLDELAQLDDENLEVVPEEELNDDVLAELEDLNLDEELNLDETSKDEASENLDEISLEDEILEENIEEERAEPSQIDEISEFDLKDIASAVALEEEPQLEENLEVQDEILDEEPQVEENLEDEVFEEEASQEEPENLVAESELNFDATSIEEIDENTMLAAFGLKDMPKTSSKNETKEDYKEELTKKITKHVHESLNESSLRDVLKDMNIKINISFEEK